MTQQSDILGIITQRGFSDPKLKHRVLASQKFQGTTVITNDLEIVEVAKQLGLPAEFEALPANFTRLIAFWDGTDMPTRGDIIRAAQASKVVLIVPINKLQELTNAAA